MIKNQLNLFFKFYIKNREAPSGKCLKLFWVKVEDLSEFWFVIARNKSSVQIFVASNLNLHDCFDIEVDYILEVPDYLYHKHFQDTISPMIPQKPMLLDLGFKEINPYLYSGFQFKGKVYKENSKLVNLNKLNGCQSPDLDNGAWEDDEYQSDQTSEEESEMMDEIGKEISDLQNNYKISMEQRWKISMEKKKFQIGRLPDEPRKNSEATPKLYWVSDCAGSENWFVIAKSQKQAENFYAKYEDLDIEGYGIKAEEIMIVPDSVFAKYCEEIPTHAQMPLLSKVGFKLISPEKNITKVVEYKGRKFCEGVS